MYAGKILKKIRIENGLNQSQMATRLNLSQSYYSAVESGKRKISGKMIEKVEDNFEVGDVFSENSSSKKSNKMRGNNEGVNEGNAANSGEKRSNEEFVRKIRDTIFMYSIYSEKAMDVLPENIKMLNAVITTVFKRFIIIKEDLMSSKIRRAIDLEDELADFFDEDSDLPPFEDYVKNKEQQLNSLLPFQQAFERIWKELKIFEIVLRKIESDLKPSDHLYFKQIDK